MPIITIKTPYLCQAYQQIIFEINKKNKRNDRPLKTLFINKLTKINFFFNIILLSQ